MALVSIAEASRLLGVSPGLIRSRIRAGAWPVYELGPRAWRIDPDEILRLVKFSQEVRREMGEKRAAP